MTEQATSEASEQPFVDAGFEGARSGTATPALAQPLERSLGGDVPRIQGDRKLLFTPRALRVTAPLADGTQPVMHATVKRFASVVARQVPAERLLSDLEPLSR